jgi:hypothetical protein
MRAALLVTSLLVVSTQALADEDAGLREASRLMKEGKDFFAHFQFEQARQRFAEACALAHTPACLSALAITELRAGKPLDAYRHFQEVMRDPAAATSVPAATREALPKMRAEAYGKLGHIDVRAPAHARLKVDGREVGSAPLQDTLDVDAGEHIVEGEDNGRRAQLAIVAPPGQVVLASLGFAPSAPDTTAPTTGKPASETPSQWMTAPPAATPAPAASSLPGFWTATRTGGVVLGCTGILGLGVGALFGVAGSNAADRAADLRTKIFAAAANRSACATVPPDQACSGLEDAYSEQSRDHAFSLVFYGIGAAALAAGAVLFFWPEPRVHERAAIWPVVGQEGAGFQLRGEL